jgi:hypothetical protein
MITLRPFTAFLRIPFTSTDVFIEYPSVTRGNAFLDRLRDDDRTTLLWAGRLHAVVSRTSEMVDVIPTTESETPKAA